MCLKPIDLINTAETDIVCYKWVYHTFSINIWKSVYQGKPFPYNVPLVAEQNTSDGQPFHLSVTWAKEINEGFHAYISRDSARRNCPFGCEYPYLKTCVIPKGSEYCLGENDEIVSTHMIVFSDDGKYEKYAAEHNDIKKIELACA